MTRAWVPLPRTASALAFHHEDLMRRRVPYGIPVSRFHAPAAARAGHLKVGEMSALLTQKRSA